MPVYFKGYGIFGTPPIQASWMGINESSLGEQQISRECSTCWLSGRVLVSRSRGFGFESHWRHCVESLSKTH